MTGGTPISKKKQIIGRLKHGMIKREMTELTMEMVDLSMELEDFSVLEWDF